MKQEEGSLTPIEIKFSSEYDLEGETSTNSILSLYTFLSPTLPSLLSSPTSINSLPTYYNMS